jgi:UDP-N-acetylglucosamine--N-acetylmuramyl-(pentapeptide) pyrophosphoryl-undecaprenol N-acetylglucosamine transferase
MAGDLRRHRPPGVADEIHLRAAVRERERVVQHARAPAEIAEDEDDDPHEARIADVADTLHGRGAPRRVAIAAGGTAGHVLPALAVAEAWRALRPDVEVVFLGTPDGIEARVLAAHGERLAAVRAAPLMRTGIGGKLRAVASTGAGTRDARRVLAAEGSEIVLGFGGYVSAGAVLGARSLGVPTVLHEANAVAGLANRLLGRVADRVLLGFESAAGAFPLARVQVTGTPVRAAILTVGPHRAPGTGRPFRILVAGGSQGSPFLDRHVPAMLARVQARAIRVEARHLVGEGDVEQTRGAYAAAGVAAEVVPFADDMADAYAWADFAIVSAGAGTLAELAAIGLPCLPVPLPAAALDHQTVNARAFAEATGSRWTRAEDWDTEALAAHLAAVAASPEAWAAASRGLARMARPAAAGAVVRACEALLGNSSTRGEGRGT